VRFIIWDWGFRIKASICIQIPNPRSQIPNEISVHDDSHRSPSGQGSPRGDGQVTLGTNIMKADANKIRRLRDGNVVCGFAGSAADAFALLERFEAKLKDNPGNVPRAATELAKEWRTDRALRRLEARSWSWPTPNTVCSSAARATSSSRATALSALAPAVRWRFAAAKALVAHSSLSAGDIVREALKIAAGIDIYTNESIVVEELSCES